MEPETPSRKNSKIDTDIITMGIYQRFNSINRIDAILGLDSSKGNFSFGDNDNFKCDFIEDVKPN